MSVNINIDISTEEKYYDYAKIVAETIFNIFKSEEDIELKNLINMIPPFKKTLNIDNWFDATTKKELEIFTIKDLKYILSVNCKKISGKKHQLINRVWEIYHSSYKDKKQSKKRRKKRKNEYKDITSVEDSDDTSGQLIQLIKKSINIYLKNNSVTNEHKRKYRRKYISNNNWVFKEYPDRYEYLGILDKDKLVKTPIPEEIETYLMCA